MEAMALGRPVISTGWSGNMTYMNHTNTCLVGYDLIPVDGSIPHYSREVLGQETVWADARVPEASVWMRRLVEDPELRRRIGAQAAQAMHAHHKQACQGEFIDELSRIWEHHSYISARAEPVQSPAHQLVRSLRTTKLQAYSTLVAENIRAANYRRWVEKHAFRSIDAQLYKERLASTGGAKPVIQLLVTARAGTEELLADTLDSIGGQIYSNWRLSIITDAQRPDSALDPNDRIQWRAVNAGDEFISTLNDAANSVAADWIVHVEAGDQLPPQALAVCVSYIEIRSQWQLIYVDEDLISRQGQRHHPRFKPGFNLDLLRSTAYVGSFLLTRQKAFREIGGFVRCEGVAGYDLTFKCIERFGETAVGHIQDILYHRLDWNDERYRTDHVEENGRRTVEQHLARTGLQGHVGKGLLPHSYFVEYVHSSTPLVTIVIPTRDKLDLFRPCIESVLGKTSYPNFEVIVVDNDSKEPATLAYMQELVALDKRVRVMRYPYAYNFSAMNNLAARDARGDYLLLLNNDTIIVQPQWLCRMVSYGQRADVGIVGARLVYPNKTVQHVGLIGGMGAHGICEHVNIGASMTAPGYLGRSQMTQNLSVVTAACMLVRKTIYDEVGGLDDAQFKVLFNDVDFCLRVTQRGWKIVWTPVATVLHHGSVSLQSFTDTQDEGRGHQELREMRERWLSVLANDPAFNRNLSLLRRDVRVDIDIDARWDPNFHERQRIMGFGAGSYGGWKYRVDQPLSALDELGYAQTAMGQFYSRQVRVPTIAELERLAPDVLLMHNTLHDSHLEAIATYKKHHSALVVFGEDDLMFALPRSNPYFKTVYKDMKKRMRRALGLVDRVVVSTGPLAEALAGMADDVRVVPNYLRKNVWDGLHCQRRRGVKPRVGWAGAQQHGGDLAIIAEVVRETADEVDWIFFGMCPESIRPHVKEFHSAVPFSDYPAKLASLDLDLAVAPLERNRFNEAKSNLRLLEYGILGWPVIASDIFPYQEGPVCRVANNPSAWARAIRERVNDLDALAREGDGLRDWVRAGWMLEDRLDSWMAVLGCDSGAQDTAVPKSIRAS
jgi:GT2 family glycosyltransferase/glycosyltransferase involved in cell wall biosynthesis